MAYGDDGVSMTPPDGESTDLPHPVRAAYLAPEGFEDALSEELRRKGVGIMAWHGRLALSAEPPVAAAWSLDIWLEPELHPVASIGATAALLRGRQRNWACHAVRHHRRAALITDRLPPVAGRPLSFPAAAPGGHLGAWTLLAADRMLLSARKSSPFVNGVVQFVEDRVGPPSRAYLKLWEACARLGAWPAPGERCVDLGASPGGWTWVIAQCGAAVVAVDRADLDPDVAAMAGVTLRRESAFGIDPAEICSAGVDAVDWLFSDIIAYPPRLLALARRWIAAGAARRIVMTIKFQGETDHETAEAFAAIPGGRVLHLWHNKHELTFFWDRDTVAAGEDGSDLSAGRVGPG
jgi:23S rRNA (cytidine2498-2'-O)-methyltransferase